MKNSQIKGWLGRVVLCIGLGWWVVAVMGCAKQTPVERHVELHEQVHEQIMPED
ncbi:MAG: hypothetical protein GWP14_10510 [Actinobacteria bacterium]|nr:hypothetical protein [Actinomycetota bacterium]